MKNLEVLLRRQTPLPPIASIGVARQQEAATGDLEHEGGGYYVEFWNIAHQARIRAFLEHRSAKVALFCRADRKEIVTKEVIFGTPNRVSRRCSNNPKFAPLRVVRK